MNFILGGVSGCIATICIQPIDFIKVQIQIRSEKGSGVSPIQIAKETLEKEGIKKFYAGLDSALLRQILYTSTRLGIFYQLTDRYQKKHGKKPPVLQNVINSIICGGIGAFLANPADLILIRMQADLNLKPEDRRNYKNVFDALSRTVNEEGARSLWRGSTPTIVRAMAMNLALLTPFEETKKLLVPYVDSARTRSILGALVAGALGSFMALPFDNIKTKLQKMKAGSDGKLPYNGVMDCFFKTLGAEGPMKLWVGLPTFYFRIAPHVIITFVCNDMFRSALGLTEHKK